jgi:uncharacterized protein YbjT (DUF2867 family)
MDARGQRRYGKILVAGATGFVGRALVPALLDSGHTVRACARRVSAASSSDNLEHVVCDVLDERTLPAAFAGVDAAYYLVHSLGRHRDFEVLDRQAAKAFVRAAEAASVRRIVYLGGVAPHGHPSAHLESRLEVGRILRSGNVPAIELRAAMIVGAGSASWQIVRDLALRLPAMILPAWVNSRLSPIALDDVVRALVDALDIPLSRSAYYDIPGSETLTAKEIIASVVALDGRKLRSVSLPWLTPRLSALWLRVVTRADFHLARELVLGLSEDLLPENQSFWDLTGYHPTRSFSDSARAALAAEEEGLSRASARS